MLAQRPLRLQSMKLPLPALVFKVHFKRAVYFRTTFSSTLQPHVTFAK